MNHYTYLITYEDGMLYHGVRSCGCNIKDDNYLGSSLHTPNERIVRKDILTTHNTREEAVSEEIKYHSDNNVKVNENYYNRSNQTSTGFDSSGIIPNEETRAKMRDAHSKRKSISEETRAKMCASHSGENHPLFGKKHSAEAKAKMSKASAGKKKSDSHKLNLSVALSGTNNPMYGKKFTEKQKSVVSARFLGKKQNRGFCNHCGREMSVSMLKRYHNDNCKLK